MCETYFLSREKVPKSARGGKIQHGDCRPGPPPLQACDCMESVSSAMASRGRAGSCTLLCSSVRLRAVPRLSRRWNCGFLAAWAWWRRGAVSSDEPVPLPSGYVAFDLYIVLCVRRTFSLARKYQRAPGAAKFSMGIAAPDPRPSKPVIARSPSPLQWPRGGAPGVVRSFAARCGFARFRDSAAVGTAASLRRGRGGEGGCQLR